MFKKGDKVTIVALWAKYVFINVQIQSARMIGEEVYYKVWRLRSANEFGSYWTTEELRATSIFANPQEAYLALIQLIKPPHRENITDPSEAIDEFLPVPEKDIFTWNEQHCSVKMW